MVSEFFYQSLDAFSFVNNLPKIRYLESDTEFHVDAPSSEFIKVVFSVPSCVTSLMLLAAECMGERKEGKREESINV